MRARAPSHAQAGLLDRAARALDRADELCPEGSEATHALHAKVLAALGERERARSAVERLAARSSLSAPEVALRDEAVRLLAQLASTAALPNKVPEAEANRTKSRLLREYVAATALLDGPSVTQARPKLLAWVEASTRAGLPTGKGRWAAALAAYLAAGQNVSPALRAELDVALRTLERDESARQGKPVKAELDTTDGFAGEVRSLAFAKGGAKLAIAHAQAVSVYDTRWWREVARLDGHAGHVRAVAWSPDGTQLASGSADKKVRLWTSEGALVRTLDDMGSVHSLAWSPDGRTLAVGSRDGEVRLWSTERGTRQLAAHKGAVAALAWSPARGSVILATASGDEPVRLWSADGTPTGMLTPPASATAQPQPSRSSQGAQSAPHTAALAWSPSGSTLAVGMRDGVVRLWTRRGRLEREFEGHTGAIASLAWSPDGKKLSSGSADASVRVWTLDGASRVLGAHTSGVSAVAWSPDGGTIAAASDDVKGLVRRPSVRLESLAGVSRHLAERSRWVQTAAWSPDGEQLATGADDAWVRVWSRSAPHLRTLGRHQDTVLTVAWSPDGKRLTSGAGDGTTRDWTTSGPTGTPRRDHRGAVQSVAWSPDGKALASGSLDGFVRVRDLGDPGSEVLSEGLVDPVRAVAWSPRGNSIAAGADTTLSVWRRKARGRTIANPFSQVHAVAWSPDGSALCSAEDDGSLRWYDASGVEQRAVKAHDKAVWALGWSPDGARLATGSRDQLVRWWSREGEHVSEWGAPSGVSTLAFHPRFEGRVAVGGSELSLVSGDESPELVAVLRTHEEGDGGFLFTADRSAVELVGTRQGPARETLRCRIGASVYAFELCAGRFELPGLVGAVFSDEVVEALL